MAEPLLSKRIIMTGGRSRLAGVVRQHLKTCEAQVISLSRSEGDSHLGLENIFVNNVLDNADALLHMAWSTVPFVSERHVGMEWNEDIPLLFRILEAIRASPNPQRLHFIFFSSGGAVYGNAVNNLPSTEDDPCEPIGWYGHGKRAAEKLIQEYGRRYGLVYTILRISNPYGFPIPVHKPQGIIPFIIKSARDGTPLSIWGDGTARKDFLHHTDFVAALAQVIRERVTGTFNVSHGLSHRVNDVIAAVEKVLQLKAHIRHVPAHPWDVHESLLDNSKLRAAIAWKPLITLDEGVVRAVADIDASPSNG